MTMYRSFHFTSIGASHIKKGTVCQDASNHVENDNYTLAVISDGHGGDDYFRSDRGSQFAVETFCRCVADAFAVSQNTAEASFLQNKAKNFKDALHACRNEKQIAEQMNWFMRSIVTRWNIMVDEDYQADPFSEVEMTNVSSKARTRYEQGEKIHSAYGATLIGAVVCDDFWFGIQIGDGKCIAFDQTGNVFEPIPWDEQCFLNVTTSICDSNASAEMRYFFSQELPAAVFVGSDGIDDSFKNERHLYNFYRVVLTSFAIETETAAVLGLNDYLPVLSAQGSMDDMSIGCILDYDYLRTHAQLYEKQKEPYLHILRIGNLGTDSMEKEYTQKKEVEAETGTVYLDVIGCAGFGKGVKELEITSVQKEEIMFKADDKEYVLTPEKMVEISTEEIRNGMIEYDRLIIRCILK